MSEVIGREPTVGAERPLAELAEELCSAAAGIAAATARWLGLVAEFDRREGWAGVGLRSCAHWLAWRCGLSPSAARDHVRVARALAGLPLIGAAFGAGRLSYSTVRALTRIADADNEADLLDIGLAGTAAHVEQIVRGWRRADRLNDPDPADTSRFGLSVQWDDDGSLRVSGRLCAEDGAMLLTALQAAKERVDSEPPASEPPATEPAATEPPDCESPATDLPVPEQPGTEPAATEPAATEPPDAERADPRLAEAEPINARRVGGGLMPDWGQDPVVPGPPKRCSPAQALLEMARAFLDPDPDKRSAAARHQVVVHIDADVLAADTAAVQAHLDGGPALSAEQVTRIGCDASLVVMLRRGREVLDVGRATRSIPAAINRALWARDGGCRFPACQERRRAHVQGHHIRFWSRGGPTALGNLILLCTFHHRQIHQNGFTLTADQHGQHLFADPTGKPLDQQPPQQQWTGTPLPPAHQDLLPLWAGERLDLHYAISVLLQARTYRRRQADPQQAAA